MAKKVTILTTAYNTASYIEESIESVLNQSYDNFTYLIIDDKSTDDTGNILEHYSKKDSRIKLIYNEKNEGISNSRRKALEIIDTEYIVMHDSDDISHPERLKYLVNFMEKNVQIGACGSFARFFGRLNFTWTYPTYNDLIKAHLFFSPGLLCPTGIMRRSVLVSNGINYPKDYRSDEDFHLYTQLKWVTQFATIPKTLYYYRRHTNNITNTNYHKIFNDKVTKIILGELDINSDHIMQLYKKYRRGEDFLENINTSYKEFIDLIIEKNQEKKVYPTEALRQIFKYFNFKYTLSAVYGKKSVSLLPIKYLNKYIVKKTLVKPFSRIIF